MPPPAPEFCFSVIIPTRNRAGKLRACLAALGRQTMAASDFEVIVANDGSRGGRPAGVAGGAFPFRLQYLRCPPRGPAAARNRALAHATGRYLLFLNDDAMLAPDALARHRAAHARRPGARIAVLGKLALPPDQTATALGHALEHSTLLFRFAEMKAGRRYDYQYFHTCNLSVPRQAVVRAGGFDESFTGPAAEDVELGYRLQLRSYRVVYEPACFAWHDHALTPEEFGRVHRRRGAGEAVLWRRQPAVCQASGRTMAELRARLAWLRREFPPAGEIRRLLRRAGATKIPEADVRAAVAERLWPLLRYIQLWNTTKGRLAVLAGPATKGCVCRLAVPSGGAARSPRPSRCGIRGEPIRGEKGVDRFRNDVRR